MIIAAVVCLLPEKTGLQQSQLKLQWKFKSSESNSERVQRPTGSVEEFFWHHNRTMMKFPLSSTFRNVWPTKSLQNRTWSLMSVWEIQHKELNRFWRGRSCSTDLSHRLKHRSPYVLLEPGVSMWWWIRALEGSWGPPGPLTYDCSIKHPKNNPYREFECLWVRNGEVSNSRAFSDFLKWQTKQR